MRNSLYKTLPGGKSLFYTWFAALHTRIDLVFCGKKEAECEYLSDLAAHELARIEKLLNRFDPESELSRVNLHAAKGETSISPELADIINDCLEWHGKTLGYFDISVQSRNHGPETPGKIHLSPGNTSIRFEETGIELDLNGYAKGYALDRCSAILRREGVTDALLNFGNSSVAALGNHPYGKGWKISGEEPSEENSAAYPPLLDQCLTTSGNKGDIPPQILNPFDGTPVPGRGSVSVITETGSVGEVLATAFFASPPDVHECLERHPELTKVFYH